VYNPVYKKGQNMAGRLALWLSEMAGMVRSAWVVGDVCSLSAVTVKWFSRRALLLHATVLIVVAACLALGWWQLERALSGNTLSWVYTFEWPFFACYAIYMWWKLLQEGSEGSRRPWTQRRQPSEASIKDEEEKLAEYNKYLAELHASDDARRN
jgi:hypothetical protein